MESVFANSALYFRIYFSGVVFVTLYNTATGILQAVGDSTGMAGALLELNGENGGLVSVSPVQSGNDQNRGGVKVSALYVPGVLPGGMVRINSSISPHFNGEYRISSATYSLDAKADAWTMELECRKGVS